MVTEHNICTMVQLNALPAANVNDSPAINNSGFHYWHESDTSGSQISYGSLQVFFINLLVYFINCHWKFDFSGHSQNQRSHAIIRQKGVCDLQQVKKQEQFKKHWFFFHKFRILRKLNNLLYFCSILFKFRIFSNWIEYNPFFLPFLQQSRRGS